MHLTEHLREAQYNPEKLQQLAQPSEGKGLEGFVI